MRENPTISRRMIEAGQRSARNNDKEKSGLLTRLTSDIKTTLNRSFLLHRRLGLIDAFEDSGKPKDGDVIKELLDSDTLESNLAKAAAKFGESMVALSNSSEIYTRFRHKGGNLLTEEDKDAHQFYTAVEQVRLLATGLNMEVDDELVAKALIEAADQVKDDAPKDIDPARLAGATAVVATVELL